MSGHVGDDGSGDEGVRPLDQSASIRSNWRDFSHVDLLVRPALAGRKTHWSWRRELVSRQEETVERSGPEGASESGVSLDWGGGHVGRTGANETTSEGLELGGTHVEEREEVRTGDTGRPPQAVSDEGQSEEEEEQEEEAGEGGSGVMEVQGLAVSPELLVPAGGTGDRRSVRREKNRVRCLRMRQRRHQQQERQQSSTAEPSSSSSSSSSSSRSSSSSEEDLVSEGLLCAVCLDVYLCPYMCHPCKHIFCEPCLRTLARGSPTNTPCPLCRTTITHVFFQKELNQTVRTFFPKEYLSRKQNFQKASCAKWPLPSCRKLFRMFGGFPRQWSPMARRRFSPHGGGFRVDPLDPLELGDLGERPAAGWRLDMDMVIIYIYSVNWIIGFLIFCLLCYIFFPSQ